MIYLDRAFLTALSLQRTFWVLEILSSI